MTGGVHYTPSHTNVCKFFQFSTYMFSADITSEMLKLCRVTKVKVLFLVLVYLFILTYLNFRPSFWRRIYCYSRVKLREKLEDWHARDARD